jgi:hypothetical protein
VHLLHPFLAADLARERQAAVDRAARRASARADRDHPSIGRRVLARGFARLSVASAVAVQRLDACLAEDLVSGVPGPTRRDVSI